MFDGAVERVRVVSTVEVVSSVMGSVKVTNAVATSSDKLATDESATLKVALDGARALLLLLLATSPAVALVTVIKVLFEGAVGCVDKVLTVRVLVGVTVTKNVVVVRTVVVVVGSVEELSPPVTGAVVYALPVVG